MASPEGSPAPAPGAARRRARPCAGPRLHVPDATPASASTFIEPTETPVAINGWPGRLCSWTAEQWDRLGAMQPPGALLVAGGVRLLYFAD